VQRNARSAAERYTRDARIAIGCGAVAIGAATASYWLWPRRSDPPVSAALDRHGAAVTVIGHF
jgi:hypothetical protein